MANLVMMGIPEDGSKPFVMAHLSFEEEANAIYQKTAHLYVQKLSGFRVEKREMQTPRRRRSR